MTLSDNVRSAAIPPRVTAVHLLLLAGLCAFMFFWRLGDRALWDVDEGKHAVVAKEMVQSGDWITPRFNGEVFFDKPVLHYWLVALCFEWLGVTEFAARLPAALMALGLVLATYFLGRRLSDSRTALWGGIILATCFECTVLARTVVHDISLSFFITLALLLFYAGFQDERHRKWYYLGCYAAAGFAALAKGPLGLLLPGMIIGTYVLVRRRFRETFREANLLIGLAVVLLIAAPWYIVVAARNPGFGSYFILHQNLERFASLRAHHSEPIYYYALVLVAGFFPWSIFLIVQGVRLIKQTGSRGFFTGPDAYVHLWFVLPIAFFSAASSKLPTYIFPAFPAMAFMTARLFADVDESKSPALRRTLFAAYAVLCGLCLVAPFLLTDAARRALQNEAGLAPWRVVPPFLCFGAGVLISFAMLLKKRTGAAVGWMAGAMTLVFACVLTVVVPPYDEFRSSRELSRALDASLPRGEKVAFYKRVKESVLFYTDRGALLLNKPHDVTGYYRTHPTSVVVMDEDDVDRFAGRLQVVMRSGTKVAVRVRPESSAPRSPGR